MTRHSVTASYMPQLDGLRALAIGAVLLHHFSHSADIGQVNFATLGVWLFFVLSGFLITKILLASRDQVNTLGYRSAFVLRQFYVRRFLRIFPLYYSVLAVAAILDLDEVRETIIWHLAYLSNYLFATLGYFQLVTAHFWSLSVEEQFYLFWPAVILFTPERFLLKIIIAAIAVGPAFRGIGYFLDINGIALYAVTLASLDTLGLGALLAYCSHHVAEKPMLLKQLSWCSLWMGIAGLTTLIVLRILENYHVIRPVMPYLWFMEPIFWALFFVWLVNGAASGFPGIVGKFLQLRPIAYIGKISYGIYVYHLFMGSLVPTVLAQSNIDFSLLPGWLQFGLLAGVTIGVAAISWHLFEGPLNALKRHFAYAEPNEGRERRQPTAVYL